MESSIQILLPNEVIVPNSLYHKKPSCSPMSYVFLHQKWIPHSTVPNIPTMLLVDPSIWPHHHLFSAFMNQYFKTLAMILYMHSFPSCPVRLIPTSEHILKYRLRLMLVITMILQSFVKLFNWYSAIRFSTSSRSDSGNCGTFCQHYWPIFYGRDQRHLIDLHSIPSRKPTRTRHHPLLFRRCTFLCAFPHSRQKISRCLSTVWLRLPFEPVI